MTIMLNGSGLTVTQVVAAARHGEAVALAPEAIATMRQARTVVQEVLWVGEPACGLTTGVGERKSFLLDPAERQRFNYRLVLNHHVAQGDAAPADVVRGVMVCLANYFFAALYRKMCPIAVGYAPVTPIAVADRYHRNCTYLIRRPDLRERGSSRERRGGPWAS